MKNEKRYWLFKSEADCYSIDDLKKDKKTAWTGIRNYQARNFIRDSMNIGDMVLFYHSSTEPIAVVGVMKIRSKPYPDPTAFEKNDDHYDSKSTIDNPMWYGIDVMFQYKFEEPVTLHQIKFNPKLKGIMVAEKGSRLSIQPVSQKHFDIILTLSKK